MPLEQCPEGETLDRLAQAVDDADPVFKDHTVDDTGGLVSRYLRVRTGWWWHRRGAVSERGVEAARVVPALDPLEHGPVEPGAGRPRAGVDQLALDRREERLRDRVVPALALASHRQHDVMLGGQRREVARGVLAAAVGVEDQPGGRLALDE